MIVISFVAFLSAQGLLSHYRTGFSLGDPGALQVVPGTGIYLTLIGVIGSVLVLFGDALGNWGKNVDQFLPNSAGSAFAESIPDGPSLTQWWGLVVLVDGFSLVWRWLWCCCADGTRSCPDCHRDLAAASVAAIHLARALAFPLQGRHGLRVAHLSERQPRTACKISSDLPRRGTPDVMAGVGLAVVHARTGNGELLIFPSSTCGAREFRPAEPLDGALTP